MAVAIDWTNLVITRTIPVHYTIVVVWASLVRTMVLHAQDEGSVALEALLIMLSYAWEEEHQLCFDGKNRQIFPFFRKNKDNLLLSP